MIEKINSLGQEVRIAVEAARLGGNALLNYWQKLQSDQIHEKGRSDFVTSADLASEEAVTSFIAKEMPQAAIVSEEGTAKSGGKFVWYIDPLDGTTNFVQKFPVFAVSIGLAADTNRDNPDFICGVVYNPVSKELFYGMKNKGSYLNGDKLQVSSKTNLKDAVIATGFPQRYVEEIDPYMKEFASICAKCHAIRRAGAAALDLCWTAQGIFDGFWEHRLATWDISAGALILEEAGGRCYDFEGNRAFLKSGNIIGASGKFSQELLQLIQDARRQ